MALLKRNKDRLRERPKREIFLITFGMWLAGVIFSAILAFDFGPYIDMQVAAFVAGCIVTVVWIAISMEVTLEFFHDRLLSIQQLKCSKKRLIIIGFGSGSFAILIGIVLYYGTILSLSRGLGLLGATPLLGALIVSGLSLCTFIVPTSWSVLFRFLPTTESKPNSE